MRQFHLLRIIFHHIFFLLLLGVLGGCTDHKTTIPFDFPDYKPKLVVLSSVGTMSGGEVSLLWSRPLKGQAGVVPPLSRARVFLLEWGERIGAFVESADSLGYYTITSDELDLTQGRPYALEILLEGSEERIISDNCYLPEKPDLYDVAVKLDANITLSYDLIWTQGYAKEGIGATAVFPYLLDSNEEYVTAPRLGAYYLSSEFRYTDGKALPERQGRGRFSRYVNRKDKEPAKSVDVRLAFLSPELALFKKEVDKLGAFGESVFQTVRPLYSNIKGGIGIFGLYNESAVKVDFEDGNVF